MTPLEAARLKFLPGTPVDIQPSAVPEGWSHLIKAHPPTSHMVEEVDGQVMVCVLLAFPGLADAMWIPADSLVPKGMRHG